MKTLTKRSRPSIGKPDECHEARAIDWDRSADHIRARSQNGCIQRPNTWLHPNDSPKRQILLLHRGRRPYMALLGLRQMSDLSPQSGPKRTLDQVAVTNRDCMSTRPG